MVERRKNKETEGLEASVQLKQGKEGTDKKAQQ
jgi:hypothetical protein